jgi:acyl-[acyl-carrier-protein]-phospholipid O-acyltransferase/long-chain-fatty-acid--[acyl-carrier-protein] ligase
VLLTDCTDASAAGFLAFARARGIAEVMVPRTVLVVDRVPVLGTGKTDYVAVKKLAEAGGRQATVRFPLSRSARASRRRAVR